MSSLAHCLELSDLHPIEKNRIIAAAAAYRKEGFSAQEANVGAVKDAIKLLEIERAAVLGQVEETREQGAVVRGQEEQGKKEKTAEKPKKKAKKTDAVATLTGKPTVSKAGKEALTERPGATIGGEGIAEVGEKKAEKAKVEEKPKPEPSKEAEPEKPVSETKKAGDSVRISDIDASVVRKESVGGVDYELYNAKGSKDTRGIVRVYDAESGQVVSIVTYPTFDQAERAYDKAVKAEKSVSKTDDGLTTEQARDAYMNDKLVRWTKASGMQDKGPMKIQHLNSNGSIKPVGYGNMHFSPDNFMLAEQVEPKKPESKEIKPKSKEKPKKTDAVATITGRPSEKTLSGTSEIPEKGARIKVKDGGTGTVKEVRLLAIAQAHAGENQGSRFLIEVKNRSGKFRDYINIRESDILKVKPPGSKKGWHVYEQKPYPVEPEPDKSLGNNYEGNEVYADADGHRYTLEGTDKNIKSYAARPIGPMGSTAKPLDTDTLFKRRNYEYLTTDELKGFDENEYNRVTKVEKAEILTKPGKDINIKEKLKEKEAADVGTSETVLSGTTPDVGESSAVASGQRTGATKKDVSETPESAEGPAGRKGESGVGRSVPPSAKGGGKVSGRRDSAARSGSSTGRTGEQPGTTGTVAGKPADTDTELVGKDTDVKRIAPPEDQNHVISKDDTLVLPGKVARAEANIKAIKLLKILQKENRNPSSNEKKILARFTGWGALSEEVFGPAKDIWRDENKDGDLGELLDMYFSQSAKDEHKKNQAKYKRWFDKYGKHLHPDFGGILTEEEWDAAQKSTLNAHYTSQEVIGGMWAIAEKLGFKNGTILEPAGGIGHFFGLMPENIRNGKVKLVGVELDTITGEMLKKLYPQANIQVKGFEAAKNIKSNSTDLVISNFPFGDYKITDKQHPEYSGWSIHNYFFARSIDTVRPGGLVIAITSHYSMDSATGKDMRDYLGSKADLVGAVRLPGTAFEKSSGTSVTTDILIFRKKSAIPFEHAQPFRLVNDIDIKGHDEKAVVNEYFVANPGMVLGKHSLSGTMYGGNEYTLEPVEGKSLGELLENATQLLPENVTGEGRIEVEEQAVYADAKTKEGLLVKDEKGLIRINRDGELIVPDWAKQSAAGQKKQKENVARAKEYIPIRDTVKELLTLQRSHEAENEEIEEVRKNLNRLYDAYVKNHGAFGAKESKFLEDDTEFGIVLALENSVDTVVDRTIKTGKNKGKVVKGKAVIYEKDLIFSQRTTHPFKKPETAKNAKDAADISIVYHGGIDTQYISKLLNIEADAVERALVKEDIAYINPKTGLFETPEEYLSGNVKRKLKEAELRATEDPEYKRNVEALKEVQPEDLGIDEIFIKLGTPWLKGEYISRFFEDVMDIRGAKVNYIETEDSTQWLVGNTYMTTKAANTYGVQGRDGIKIVTDCLNLKQSKVIDYWMEDGKKKQAVNKEQTALAQNMQKKIQEAFTKWIRDNDDIIKEMEEHYNENYNNWVLKKFYVPELAYYPGASTSVTLNDHQKRAVSRGVQESCLLAHSVGTGKTYIMITAAMEMKRLGTAKKPIIVVQPTTIDQFRGSFKKLYPDSKIYAPTKKETEGPANRKKVLSKIAMGNWDAVVVDHNLFDMMVVSPEREAAYLRETIQEFENTIRQVAEEEGKKSPTVKQLVKATEKKKEKLNTLLAKGHAENILYWEDMGIDALFVDEVHRYKRSEFSTKMQGIKGIDQASAGRSTKYLLKSNAVRELTGGKNVVTATGTPISNTLTELWTMLRYVRPDLLKEYNSRQFDNWAANFGDVAGDYEELQSGEWGTVYRFSQFNNGVELLTMWRAAADVILKEDVNLKTPDIKGGGPQLIEVPRSPDLKQVIDDLKAERVAWDKLTGKEKRESSHVPLTIWTRAKKATIDLRLLDSSYPDLPESKVNFVAKDVYETWKKFESSLGTQMVFCDSYNSPDKKFNVYRDMTDKLVKRGIPRDEIAWINDYTDAQRRKLFQDMRDGTVRVLMGHTDKIGVGVDCPELMVKVHHLDIVGRPMDFEQRNGRIDRQSNTNDEIEISVYGVKDTLDSTLFQRLIMKQKFINQILRGDIKDRSFEDPFNDQQETFQSMMAAMSGTPLARDRFMMINKIRDLESLKDSSQKEKTRARQTIRTHEREIEGAESDAIFYDDLVAKINKAMPETDEKGLVKITEFTIEGKTYEQKEFATELDKIAENMKDAVEKELKGKEYNSGDYYDMESGFLEQRKVTLNGIPVRFWMVPDIERDPSKTVKEKGRSVKYFRGTYKQIDMFHEFITSNKDRYDSILRGEYYHRGQDLVRLARKNIEDIKAKPERIEGFKAQTEKSIKELKRLLTQKFDKENELEEAKEELVRIEAEIDAQTSRETGRADEKRDEAFDQVEKETSEKADAVETVTGLFSGEVKPAYRKRKAGFVGKLKQDELQKEVDSIVKNWKNSPKIVVVQSQRDLPARLRRDVAGDVDGAFYLDDVYLVADNLTSVNHAVVTLLHESFGHYGLRGMFRENGLLQPEYNKLLDDVYAAKRAEVDEVAARYGLDVSTEKGRNIAAEEWLSWEAENLPESDWVDRLVKLVRNLVRAVGIDLKLSDAEIRQLIVSARRFVEQGPGVRDQGLGMMDEVPVFRLPTGPEVDKDIQEDRSFANRIHEQRDSAIHNAGQETAELQKRVQMLAGEKSRRKHALGFAYDTKYKQSKESNALDRAMMVWRDLQINPEKADEYREWAKAALISKDTSKSRKMKIKEQLDILERAENLTDEQKTLVDEIGERFDKAFEIAKANKVISSFLDHYVRRIWKRPKDMKDGFMSSGTGYGFKTSTTARMQRSFETIVDGWMKGYDLQIEALTNSYGTYLGELETVLANKDFIMQGYHTKDLDGRNMFSTTNKGDKYRDYVLLKAPGFKFWEWAGKAETHVEPDGSGALFVNEYGRNFFAGPVERTPETWAVYRAEGKSRRAIRVFDDQGAAEEFADERKYETRIEHRKAKDVAEFWEPRELYAPKQLATIINKMTATDTLFADVRALEMIGRFNAGIKSWILLSSFFHHMAGARSWTFGVHHGWKKGEMVDPLTGKTYVTHGVNMVAAYKAGMKKIEDRAALITLAIKNGLTLGEMQDWGERLLLENKGFSERLANHIGLEKVSKAMETGRFMREQFTNSLFKKFFAGLKAEAFCMEFVHELQKAQTKYEKGGSVGKAPNVDKIAEQVTLLINADFGGLHLQRMGRNPTFQKFFRMLFLAPDWTESNFKTVYGMMPGLEKWINKMIGDIPGPVGMAKIYKQFWGRVALRIGVSTMLMQMMLNGVDDSEEFWKEQALSDQFHKFRWTDADISKIYEALGVDTEGKRVVLSIGGHFFDPLKLFDPPRLIKGKASPLIRATEAVFSGTDWRERPFTGAKELVTTGKTIKKSPYEEEEGAWNRAPATIVNQVTNMQPVQVGFFIRWLQGEDDYLTSLMRSAGVAVHGAWPSRLTTPVVRDGDTDVDPVYDAILDLQYKDVLKMGPPSKSITVNGMPQRLTAGQYDNYLDMSSEIVRNRLKDVVVAENWKNMSDKRRVEIIERIVKSARKRARQKMKRILWQSTAIKKAV